MTFRSVAKSYAYYLSDLAHSARYRHARQSLPAAPAMKYSTLSRSGMKASVVGLGTGGPSRLGRAHGKSTNECLGLIRAAVDAGINFIDTSEAYGTERILGLAMRSFRREELIISSKIIVSHGGRLISPRQLQTGADCSLRRLGSEYIDYYLLHAVTAEDYDYVTEALVPALDRLREQGKVRYLGISEAFTRDPKHLMLTRAVRDDFWDTILLGFNLANPSARGVIQEAQGRRIAVAAAFVMRDLWHETARDLRNSLSGLIDGTDLTLPELAFRFCGHEPGIDVVLTGTGSLEHLTSNVRSFLQGPLPDDLVTRVWEKIIEHSNPSDHV